MYNIDKHTNSYHQWTIIKTSFCSSSNMNIIIITFHTSVDDGDVISNDEFIDILDIVHEVVRDSPVTN